MGLQQGNMKRCERSRGQKKGRCYAWLVDDSVGRLVCPGWDVISE